MRNSIGLPAIMMLFVFGSVGIVACDSQGPAEEAGENIDDAAEESAESWEESREEVKEKLEKERGDE